MNTSPSLMNAGTGTPNAVLPDAQSAHLSRILSWVVLVVGLMITTAVTISLKAGVERRAEQDFIVKCQEMQHEISDRLDDHVRILLSGAALFKASDVVTRAQWHIFTQHQQVEKQLPGIQGIGFSLQIPRAELTRQVQKMRHEGFPEYKLWPDGDREVYSSIIYLEPFAGRNLRAFGYDMLSEPVRRAAMERARDTDSAALSGKVVLVQEMDEEVQAGTLMYVPVYRKGLPIATVEQRRAAIYGWVYSPYRMNDLMQGILGKYTMVGEEQVRLQIFAGPEPTHQTLLYESLPAGNKNSRGQISDQSPVRFTRQNFLDFSGQGWTLRFQQTGGGLSPREYITPWLTGVGGILITLLLFALIRSLLNTHADAQRIAEKLTEELRESENRARSITEAAQDAILMMDPNGRVSYWNPAAERTLGYTNSEALGKDVHLLLAPPRYLEAHRAASPVFQQTGRGAAMGKLLDLEALRKDGTEIAVQLSFASVRIKGEYHAIGILRDITAQKQGEAKLLEVNRQLAEATAQAEQANAAKSDFLATMSHEIRTPMNGVIGLTGLLLDTDLTDKQRQYAELVRLSGESLLLVINDILDFSKIEAGKLELETHDFDLSSMLDDFAATLALRAHEKGLELVCAADPEVPVLLQGDPGRLRQILCNLTGNAIKFTPAGEVMVRVSLVETQGNNVRLRFSVRDTGIGIPQDKRGRLFNKFSQVETSTTRQYGGTGLGLAISKQLAGLMGGEIGVESEVGSGSEFWFTVLLGKQAVCVMADLPLTDLHKVRALIVDDNATNREILKSYLTSWGMRPSEARDGAEALHVLEAALDENDPFRIAVIDMLMPGMNGEELGRTIKVDKRLAGTRLVMLASLGMRGDARFFEEIGFAAYMTKPVRHRELKGVLALALAEQGGTDSTHQRIATRHTARETKNLVAHSKIRILLAEDNKINQQVALGMLKKLGIYADVVANGAEAVDAFNAISYDLIIMDVQMPEMDGIEATRRIRRSATGNRQVPIIAMTANAVQGDREQYLAAGMSDYLSKPVSSQELADTLDKWLPKELAMTSDNAPQTTAGATRFVSDSLIFDKAGLLERLMDDDEVVRALVAEFIVELPREIEALQGYLAAGDVLAVQHQAHKIKGVSANMGGERLRTVAAVMEKAARDERLNVAGRYLAELEEEFGLLKEAMQAAEWGGK